MPCRRHSSPVSTPASDSFRMAMICSSLNRLFLTTPPPALAGHRKWRSHIPTGLIFGGQVKKANFPCLELVEQDYVRAGKKTWDDVLCRWNLHLKDHFADIRASELGSDHINDYIFLRQREKASGGSINRELAVI